MAHQWVRGERVVGSCVLVPIVMLTPCLRPPCSGFMCPSFLNSPSGTFARDTEAALALLQRLLDLGFIASAGSDATTIKDNKGLFRWRLGVCVGSGEAEALLTKYSMTTACVFCCCCFIQVPFCWS